MKSKEPAFRFELSSAELQWLSGAFGLMRLPLPNPPIHPTQQANDAALHQAQDSLQRRNLIHRAPGMGWQVDRLPAVIIRWLGSAEQMIIIDVHNHDGSSRRAYVFVEQGAKLFVTVEEKTYHFVLLRDRVTLAEHLLDWLGASFSDLKPAPAKYALPQPLTILRAAWRDSALASKMLKVTGLEPTGAKSVLAWAESQMWIAELTRVRLDAEKPEAEVQTILCATKQGVWAGTAGEKAGDVVNLSSIDKKELQALIYNLQ